VTLSRHLTITNELGLHARSAAKIVAATRAAKGGVWIEKDGERADATSVIDLLALSCGKGTRITLRIDNLSDSEIMDKIEELVNNGFGE
jgi:phosphocarrier protein HPr